MLELLEKYYWSLSDIQAYFQVGKTKASELMQEAKKISCNRWLPKKAKRDALFKVMGISFDDEIEKLKKIKENLKDDFKS